MLGFVNCFQYGLIEESFFILMINKFYYVVILNWNYHCHFSEWLFSRFWILDKMISFAICGFHSKTSQSNSRCKLARVFNSPLSFRPAVILLHFRCIAQCTNQKNSLGLIKFHPKTFNWSFFFSFCYLKQKKRNSLCEKIKIEKPNARLTKSTCDFKTLQMLLSGFWMVARDFYAFHLKKKKTMRVFNSFSRRLSLFLCYRFYWTQLNCMTHDKKPNRKRYFFITFFTRRSNLFVYSTWKKKALASECSVFS